MMKPITFEDRANYQAQRLKGFMLREFSCGCVGLPLVNKEGEHLLISVCDADHRIDEPDSHLGLTARLVDKPFREVDGASLLARLNVYAGYGKDMIKIKSILS